MFAKMPALSVAVIDRSPVASTEPPVTYASASLFTLFEAISTPTPSPVAFQSADDCEEAAFETVAFSWIAESARSVTTPPASTVELSMCAAVLAGASNEQTTMGRKTLAGVTSTVNDTSDKRIVDADNITWTAATGNATAKLVICYDPDTTGGSDSDLIPLYFYDFAVTPAGGDVTFAFNASGLAESA